MGRTYSIRTVLMTLMIGEIIIAITLTAWLWYGNGQASVKSLTEDRCSEISSRVEERIMTLILAAQNTAEAQKQLVETGLVDPSKKGEVDQLLQFQLQHLIKNRFLTSIAIGMPDGSLFGVQRDSDGKLQLLRSEPGQDVLEEVAVLDGNSKRIEGFSVVDRPWYREAVESNGAGWTGIYKFPGIPPQLGSSAYQVIEDEEGSLIGVALCDITLGPIDQFLRGLTLTENGRSFVIDKAGLLIATSRGDSLIKKDDGSLQRVAAIDCNDSFIRETMEITGSEMGDLATWAGSGILEIDTSAGPVQLAWNPILGLAGIDLISLIAIPTDDLVQEISDRTRFTAIAFLVLILLTIPIVWRTAWGITRPVRELNSGMKRISRFEIDGDSGLPSRLTELNQMQIRMEAMRHALASFEKYVPSRVVRQLVTEDRVAVPGMEPATACVYFSDVVGFTTIAETLPPEKLVQIGGEYLQEMSQQVLDESGIIDKFIGDAIMAFWIAEIDGSRVTANACRAAINSQKGLVEMREDWGRRNLPQMKARIGLHTGPVLVGNMGSSSRLNYTVIGDTVNLASRLEGLNRLYGTDIIVSEEVAKIVADEMHCRILDHVAVKGRRQGGAIYQLVCEADSATESQIVIANQHNEALKYYQDGQFEKANSSFEDILRSFPEDLPARALADRCLQLSKNPPKNWSGFSPLDRNIQETQQSL